MQDIKSIIENFELGSEASSARILEGKKNESYLVDLLDGSSVLFERFPASDESSEQVMRNIAELSEYLKSHGLSDEKDAIRYVMTKSGEYCLVDGDALWRGVNFINRAHVQGDEAPADKARELGRALGLFHKRFVDFPVDKLNSVIPNHHNTPLHFANFEAAVAAADPETCNPVQSELGFAQKQQSVCGAILKMDLPARVTNNHVSLRALLLDNETGKAVRLSSYDYAMPGMLPFDFGDGAASCCKVAADDERNLGLVSLDPQLFKAYCEGYLSEMKPHLVGEEPASLALSVVVMPLESGLKYLTTYLTEKDEDALARARVMLLVSMQAQRMYKELVATVRDTYMAVE